jgi:hypothetical protein
MGNPRRRRFPTPGIAALVTSLLIGGLLWWGPEVDVAPLDLVEGFDHAWKGRDATCDAGAPTFVRRVAARAQGGNGARHWKASPSGEHRAPECSRRQGCVDSHVASHRFGTFEEGDDSIGLVNDGVLEILTTRKRQSGPDGRLRVDLHVPEDVAVAGAGEHYLVMHNLVLTEAPGPRDCADVADTATHHATGPQRYRWYGVIGGAFGEPADIDSPIEVGSVGFAVEVPSAIDAPGDRPNDLIDESFLPYSVGGAGEVFPSGWYRIEIESGPRIYRYAVRRWDGTTWIPIVPDDASSGGTHERSFPTRRLSSAFGRPLPPGYVGLGVAWFGGRDRLGAHVDWDDLVVDW